ncbi:unnamed protein product [Rotaria sp. Silwood1]|nr:unnamed protein product [Rotaria sp. Silwood1]
MKISSFILTLHLDFNLQPSIQDTSSSTSIKDVSSINDVYNLLSNYAEKLMNSSRENILKTLIEPKDKFQYHNYDSMIEKLKELNNKYPNITSLYTIGKSNEKRDLWVMIISDQPLIHEPGEPEVKYIGNMHGDESVGRECLILFIEYLCINYEKHDYITQLVNNSFIHDCPTGRLDKKKFVEMYRQFYPNGKADNYCKYAFNRFDTNNDGTIDFQEFLLAIAATSQGPLDDRLTAVFNMYDFSHNRVIDQKELTTIITAMYDLVGETDHTGDHDPKKLAAHIVAQLDIDGDKKLKIREWHVSFTRDCPTGGIDKKKFIEFYKQFYPNGKADNYCKYAFNTFDTNNDGTIDFQEFLLAIAATSQGDLDARLGTVFDMYDFSHNGVIDQKELTTIITAMYDLVGKTDREGNNDPKKLATEIIAEFDANNDKKLSKGEFIAGCKNNESIRRLLAPHT